MSDMSADQQAEMDWLTRVAAEQRALMAQRGYTPDDVAAAADEDPGEQGEARRERADCAGSGCPCAEGRS